MKSGVDPSRVARTGHPFFIAAATLAALLALWPLFLISSHAATGGGYRLAGIVAVGKDYLGFLELPEGGQILVRQGSVINGGGKVVELDSERLKIAFPDRTIDLELAGSGASPDAPTVASTDRDSIATAWDGEAIVMREVDPVSVAQSLRTTGASPAGTGKRADAGAEVARRFAAIANLPANALVLAINELPVQSADAAIRQAEKVLVAGGSVSLKLAAAGDAPEIRVYLMPMSQ